MQPDHTSFLSDDEQSNLANTALRLAQWFDGPDSLTPNLREMTRVLDKNNPNDALAELAVMHFNDVTGEIRRLLAASDNGEYTEALFQQLKPLLEKHGPAIDELCVHVMTTEHLHPNIREDFCFQLRELNETLDEIKTQVESKIAGDEHPQREWRDRSQRKPWQRS
ncbi:MAG: hypothetical protein K2X09_02785 [Rickettsiales bacterium]|nr:hypothetical protein [Rickettsiales bacterium]